MPTMMASKSGVANSPGPIPPYQALKNMDEFVSSAEKTAAAYQHTDQDSASGFRYS